MDYDFDKALTSVGCVLLAIVALDEDDDVNSQAILFEHQVFACLL